MPDYHCRVYLLKWEPFPKLLPPKNPSKINSIGPLVALTLKAIINPPLALGYIYEELKEKGGLLKVEEESLELRAEESHKSIGKKEHES